MNKKINWNKVGLILVLIWLAFLVGLFGYHAEKAGIEPVSHGGCTIIYR